MSKFKNGFCIKDYVSDSEFTKMTFGMLSSFCEAHSIEIVAIEEQGPDCISVSVQNGYPFRMVFFNTILNVPKEIKKRIAALEKEGYTIEIAFPPNTGLQCTIAVSEPF